MVARQVGAGFKIGPGSGGLTLSGSSRPSLCRFGTWAQLLGAWSLTSAVVGVQSRFRCFCCLIHGEGWHPQKTEAHGKSSYESFCSMLYSTSGHLSIPAFPQVLQGPTHMAPLSPPHGVIQLTSVLDRFWGPHEKRRGMVLPLRNSLGGQTGQFSVAS